MRSSRICTAELVVGVTLPRCLGGDVLLKIPNGDLSVPLEDAAGVFQDVSGLHLH